MEWREKERQVWQRVLAPTAPDPGPDWQELLNQAAQSAGAYRYLAGALPGKRRETAGQLYRESLETLACLRGLCRLQGREPGRTEPVPVSPAPAERVLAAAYHRARRAAAEYTARWGEPEWGCVFRELSRREERHCLLLALMMGS